MAISGGVWREVRQSATQRHHHARRGGAREPRAGRDGQDDLGVWEEHPRRDPGMGFDVGGFVSKSGRRGVYGASVIRDGDDDESFLLFTRVRGRNFGKTRR